MGTLIPALTPPFRLMAGIFCPNEYAPSRDGVKPAPKLVPSGALARLKLEVAEVAEVGADDLHNPNQPNGGG